MIDFINTDIQAGDGVTCDEEYPFLDAVVHPVSGVLTGMIKGDGICDGKGIGETNVIGIFPEDGSRKNGVYVKP